MTVIPDINNQLDMKKAAEIVAKPNGKIVCHPNNIDYFKDLPADKVQICSFIDEGTSYAIDMDILDDFMGLKSNSHKIDYEAFNRK